MGSAKNATTSGYGLGAPPAISKTRGTAKGKKSLTSIRIEVAKNGYTVQCEYYTPPSSGKSDSYVPYDAPERKPMVFETPQAVTAYVSKELGVSAKK